MAEPFLGEVRLFAFSFPPKGWAMCNGQLLPIAQNQSLFALLGVMYGGDGNVNFALPDLRARTPIHMGRIFIQGQRGGEIAHTLIVPEMPQHLHTASATSVNGTINAPGGNDLAAASDVYRQADNPTTLHPASVRAVGGSQPHENRQPYLVINFCVALAGTFPSRN